MNNEIMEISKTKLYFDLDDTDYIIIQNCITNLQKENENLKNVMFTGRNYNEVLKSEQDYKSRNEKAIEYINKNILIGFNNAGFKTDKVAGIIVDDLLNILKGGDEK